MFNKMCNYMNTGQGKMVCAVAMTVGGLHLLLTAPQPVLGLLPAFDFSLMGRTIGAQQVVGAVVLTCGVCCLRNCM